MPDKGRIASKYVGPSERLQNMSPVRWEFHDLRVFREAAE